MKGASDRVALKTRDILSNDRPELLRELIFTVIESLPGGIMLVDGKDRLVAINQTARNFLGLLGRSLTELSCWEILKNALNIEEDRLAALLPPGASLLCQAVSDTADAGMRQIAITRHELKSPFLQISGFLLTVTDVTYSTLLEAQAGRQTRFVAMQDMAVNMNQELKNPLGSLELYLSILKRDLAYDEESGRIVLKMEQAVRTMDHLLNNFMTFTGPSSPVTGRVAVRAWLEESVKQLRLLDMGKEIIFDLDFGHLFETIPGDADLLEQLVMNIGMNAVESMGKNGRLRIETRTVKASPGTHCLLEVRFVDNGRGISKENLSKVFDPFFTTKKQGSGLGLAIVHYIVMTHHGLVNLESREDYGTTITVLLPSDDSGLRQKGV